MKAILRLELRINGLSKTNEPTHEYHTAGAVINLPAMPNEGRWLYFNSIKGICPINGGEVELVEWEPDESRRNVLVPYIWLKEQTWEEDKPHKLPIRAAVASCKGALAKIVPVGSVQLELID